MIPLCSLRDALADPNLLGSVLPGESWARWRALLIASMGEPLLPDELLAFRDASGRQQSPTSRVEELWAVIGRRGGKDRAASVLASYLSALCDHDDVLVPGERGVVLVIAPDTSQARIQLDYIDGAFRRSPVLAPMVANRTADVLSLRSGIEIEVRGASFRRLRGPTAVAVIATEAAFWHDSDSSLNPDTEILNAVRPALATTGGPLIVISSPYARKGELWETYRRHYGADGDPAILVVQGSSRDFNPTLPQSVINRALARDVAAASAEYLAQFRSDIESFVSREVVDACVPRGVRERAPLRGPSYSAFCDPSGGGADSMTLAVAHREGDLSVLDALREVRPPFSPESVVAEFCALLKSYRVLRVQGDRYAGEWPREQFRKHGVSYDAAAKPKSDIYRDALPLVNSGAVSLLDQPRLVAQLCSLERRTSRGGRDSIDHPPRQHDDLANAACGALTSLRRSGTIDYRAFVRGDPAVSQRADVRRHPALAGRLN